MVERETIEALPPGMKESVEIAFMTLASSGVLLKQLEIYKLRLLEGFGQVDAQELAQRIIDAQQMNRVLLGIHELGTTYVKEKSSE